MMAQMNAALARSAFSPSLLRSSGSHSRWYVPLPDHRVSQADAVSPSRRCQSRMREAWTIVAASRAFSTGLSSGKRTKSTLVVRGWKRPPA
jgi:hypothetical protein